MNFMLHALILASLLVTSSCVSIYLEKPTHNLSFASVADRIIDKRLGLETFKKAGPFKVLEDNDISIKLSSQAEVSADLYLSYQKKAAPLLIFQHGNKADKSVHSNQAKRAASWGFHSLVIDQPNVDQWMQNGKALDNLIRQFYQNPEQFDYPIDRNRIILIGHSFGASAAALAAGLGAPIRGLILLDPALFKANVSRYLKKITAPTIIIGADQSVFKSRKRNVFFDTIPSNKIEVSVKGSTHNDAQYPNMFSWNHFLGLAKSPSKDHQETFTGAIITSALSFASTGSHVYAWHIFNRYRLQFKEIKRR